MDARIRERRVVMLGAGRLLALALAIVAAAASENAQAYPGAYVLGGTLFITGAGGDDTIYVGASGGSVEVTVDYPAFSGVPYGGEDVTAISRIEVEFYDHGTDMVSFQYVYLQDYTNLTEIVVHHYESGVDTVYDSGDIVSVKDPH